MNKGMYIFLSKNCTKLTKREGMQLFKTTFNLSSFEAVSYYKQWRYDWVRTCFKI